MLDADNDVFACGQTYVALSRAISFERVTSLKLGTKTSKNFTKSNHRIQQTKIKLSTTPANFTTSKKEKTNNRRHKLIHINNGGS